MSPPWKRLFLPDWNGILGIHISHAEATKRSRWICVHHLNNRKSSCSQTTTALHSSIAGDEPSNMLGSVMQISHCRINTRFDEAYSLENPVCWYILYIYICVFLQYTIFTHRQTIHSRAVVYMLRSQQCIQMLLALPFWKGFSHK